MLELTVGITYVLAIGASVAKGAGSRPAGRYHSRRARCRRHASEFIAVPIKASEKRPAPSSAFSHAKQSAQMSTPDFSCTSCRLEPIQVNGATRPPAFEAYNVGVRQAHFKASNTPPPAFPNTGPLPQGQKTNSGRTCHVQKVGQPARPKNNKNGNFAGSRKAPLLHWQQWGSFRLRQH